MTTRAAVNILGATGAVIDITSLGVDTITTEHPGPGQYLVYGTLGMAPPPEGWGYVLNQADAGCSVAISYNDTVLAVSIAKEGEPADLAHSITLHVAVDALPPQEAPQLPPPVVDPLEAAQSEITRLRSAADYAIAPLQDAVDVDEATDADLAELKAWKKYRVALSRVIDQANYPQTVDWPVVPT
ncbi:tail fiber assembly protein [Pseudomonas sp. MUP55]|uniref:tail fiber assembly protein n=1 Tax=Pseudomonas sp. MUP55 TaxID=3087234 RepID=UPI002A5ABF54|nr:MULTISPECIES: tail fiber assembly protein [unclassified Pseudomonas]WPN90298.1 tail fiber assembly protein [Pseudomonas sp. MUP56]WPN95822.1 tail fiber assembly protein [Pseudomonas sp. MUP55]